MNGDSPYPEIGPIGKVLPQLTPVEIMGRTSGDGSDDEANSSPISSLDKRHAHTHTMSTRRVCWHRNTSISMQEHSLSVRVSSEQCAFYIRWILNRFSNKIILSKFCMNGGFALSLALSVNDNRRDVIVDSYLAILFDDIFVFFVFFEKKVLTVERSNSETQPF